MKNNNPLNLTVHRLPEPNISRTTTGRWKMLLVLLICALPVVASYFTYYVIRPNNTKSFGELITPQRPIPPLIATNLAGQPQPLSTLRGQWLIVSIASGQCGTPCEQHLYMQRQLRETLGKEKERVDWVWLISDNAPLPEPLHKRLTNPVLQAQGFHALRLTETDLITWLQAPPDAPSSAALAQRLYLIDPQGNYMMRFPANMTLEQATKAKTDLNRLLRAASFWDTPGRLPPPQKTTNP